MPIPQENSIPGNQAVMGFQIATSAGGAVPLQQSENSAAADHRLRVLGENLLGRAGKQFHSMDVMQAVSSSEMLTGDAGADHMSMVALGQQLMKGAQTAAPVTPSSPVV